MPKTKNRRKNGKTKKYTGPKYHKVRTVKIPHCIHCGADTRLATNTELLKAKTLNPDFKESFLFLPQCNCWETNETWMTS